MTSKFVRSSNRTVLAKPSAGRERDRRAARGSRARARPGTKMPEPIYRALPEPLDLLPPVLEKMKGRRIPPPLTSVALAKDGRLAAVCVGAEVRLLDCDALDVPSREKEKWRRDSGARTVCCAFGGAGDSLLAVGDALGRCHLFKQSDGSVTHLLRHARLRVPNRDGSRRRRGRGTDMPRTGRGGAAAAT